MKIMPRIIFDSENKIWKCHNSFQIWGSGETPTLAFCDWKIREARRSRIPRAGVWNRKSVNRWYAEGGKPTNYYIGSKQVFGYDPKTDELILRG